MSFVIRALKEQDFSGLYSLVHSIKNGLASLPSKKDMLQKKVDYVLTAFDPKIKKPKEENYLFVLEDFKQKKIVGTCGLYATTTDKNPFIHFKQETLKYKNAKLKFARELQTIQLTRSTQGNSSELCSLFLSPYYRSHKLGHLLSFSRYHFIHKFPERFTKEIVASMLGFRSRNGRSPFWRAVIKPFFGKTLDLAYTQDNETLYELLPKEPLYVHMFPSDAQVCIGKVHTNTKPALGMLQRQGFEMAPLLDPLDAGPYVRCDLKNVKTIKSTKTGEVTKILPPSDSSWESKHLIGNLSLDFRACQGDVTKRSDGSLAIPSNIAEMLNIEPGMTISYSPLK